MGGGRLRLWNRLIELSEPKGLGGTVALILEEKDEGEEEVPDVQLEESAAEPRNFRKRSTMPGTGSNPVRAAKQR